MTIATHTTWDAIVIGAGPAGGLAALLLAREGRRVLLVERKSLPRYKVCGGCISAAGMALLTSVVGASNLPAECANQIDLYSLHARGQSLEVPFHGGAAVSRTVLDDWLAHEAIASGAAFLGDTVAHVGEVHAETRAVQIESPSLPEPIALQAKLVIAADGLGHPSLRRLAAFRENVSSRAHLGAGCELAADWPVVREGTIHMAVGRQGYVGFVRYDERTINVAAALAPQFVRNVGLGGAVAQTLQEAGIDPPPSLAGEHWQGTALLTRRTHPPAAERLFVIGDAAGYVEPFTGEGITWALQAAQCVVPLARRGIDRWENSLAAEWSGYQNRLGRRQLSCRAVTAALRWPRLLALAMGAGRACPPIAVPLVQWFG